MRRQLTIVFFDAGGGHRSAAEALKSVLETQQHPWHVSLLNIQEQLDKLDLLRRATGIRIQDAYNLILRKGWTRLTPQLLPVLQTVIRIHHTPTVKMLCNYWKQHPADMVLSVIPHFTRSLAESVRKTIPKAPLVTLLTDFADYPPHFWMEHESEYIICGTERAEQQAFALGHDCNHVFRASGMVMKPKFYQKRSLNRTEERRKLVLDPDLPTGIVLFGGHGSSTMIDVVRRLERGRSQLQLILICGKNQKLLRKLKRLETETRFHIFVEGFTSDIDYYMSVSDFFIGKPGPGCISEALQFHLPVIVECNGRTLPQERYNARWISENRLGIVLKSFRHIAEGVEQLLEPATFSELRNNAAAYSNHALLEIPGFFEEILERHRPRSTGVVSQVLTKSALERAAWASTMSRELGSPT
ncbi:MAG TPA: glycosyltransferase [Terriglobales bacterium]|nr:glycosyltransferase [Terriglobales bacterium]